MLFKNLILYRLPQDWTEVPADLELKLADRCLFPCAPFEMQSRGWIDASPAQRLMHTIEQQRLIALGVEQKLLPSSVIRQVVVERAAKFTEDQGFPCGRKQLRDLRLAVTEELKSRALSRRTSTLAWIDGEDRWFAVNAASAKRAEDVIDVLRNTIGSFAAVPLGTERSPAMSMAQWLHAGAAPNGFTLDDSLELRAGDKSPAVIRYTQCAPESRELRARLAAGMLPTRLGLTWNGRISFVLTDKLVLKQIEFLELADQPPADDDPELDPVERFDAELLLMSGELRKLIADLIDALGGETAAPALVPTAAAAA